MDVSDLRYRSRFEEETDTIDGIHFYPTWSKTSEMWDKVIPNFAALSARGYIFNNPMQQKFVELVYPNFTISSETSRGILEFKANKWPSFLPLPVVDSDDTETIEDLATTEAHANVGVDQLDLLVSIAELHESVSTIANVGLKLAKVFKKIRKFNLKAIKGLFSVRDIRDQYLEFRYGLRPMYYDLKSVHDYLQSEISPRRQTARGYSNKTSNRGSDTCTTYGTRYHPTSDIPTANWTSFSRQTSVEMKSRAGVLFAHQFTDNLSKVLAELGVDRPISACWELIPFSFMMDWFANIGDTIRAWEPKPHISSLASWTVTTVTRESSITTLDIELTKVHKYPTTIYDSLISPATAVCRSTTKVRTPGANLSIIPSFDINLSMPKLIDMGAIFHTLVDSRRRQGW